MSVTQSSTSQCTMGGGGGARRNRGIQCIVQCAIGERKWGIWGVGGGRRKRGIQCTAGDIKWGIWGGVG